MPKQFNFWAVQNGLMGRIKFEDPADLGNAVATVEKAIAQLDKATAATTKAAESVSAIDERLKKVEIEVVKGDWRNDMASLKESVKNGAPKEVLQKAISEIMEAEEAERIARGYLPAHVEEQMKSLTDPHNEQVEYLSWKGRKGNVENKQQHALDILESVIRSAPRDDMEKHFQHMATDAMICDALGVAGMGIQKWAMGERGSTTKGLAKHLPNVAEKWLDYKRAVLSRYMGKAAGAVTDTAEATNVAEWVPAAWSPEMRSKIISRSRLIAQMPRIFYSGPGKTYDLPVNLTDPVADLVTEATTYAQAMGNPLADPWQMANALISAKKTFTFFLARTRFLYSGMVDEDSMVPVLPLVRQMLELGHAQGEEKCWINGQKSGAIDTGGGGPGTYDIVMGADGFRKFTKVGGATVEADHGNVAITTTAIMRTLRSKLGENGLEAEDLILAVSPSVFYQMTVLPEVWTAEKFPSPTIVSGNLAVIGGIAIVPTRFVREDLNATGIYDAVTMNRTVAILVNKRAWLEVEKRDMTIEMARYAHTDTNDVLAMRRYDLGNVLGSTQKTTATLYNIAV